MTESPAAYPVTEKMNLVELNRADKTDARAVFGKCCTATRWIREMIDGRPYASVQAIKEHARAAWSRMDHEDYLEAFEGHPKIGDPESLKKKYRDTLHTASSEQSGVNDASERILDELARYNRLYEARFGFIFIVYASGKSAQEMLDIMQSRLDNDPNTEIRTAAGEQVKITANRIDGLFA